MDMVKFTPTLVLFLLFSCLNTSFAQYNPRFLIPYKSDKLWGWSDTLGNELIQPKYKGISYFSIDYSEKPLARLGNVTNGFIYVKPDGSLLFPENVKYISYDSDKERLSEWTIVQDANVKKGIFSISLDKLVVPTVYEWIFLYNYEGRKYALLKKESERHYQILNSKREIKKTKIVSFFTFSDAVIYTDSRNRHGYLRGEEFEPMTKKEFNLKVPIITCYGSNPLNPPFAIPINCVSTSDMAERNQSFKKITGKEFIHQKTYCENRELSNTTYYVVKENGTEGVFTQSGALVVPIKYDKIEFTEDTPGISLLNNGKYGFMQLPVQFPVIEQKYNSPLSFERILYGTKGEKFSIYKVKRNGNYVFVGQNGVEFFKD
jgi:hypothetical protein